MKRKLLILAFMSTTALMLSNTTLPVQAGDFDGNAACEACLENAQQEWEVCVETEAGGDRGDADCESRRIDAIIHCQTHSCIN